MLYTNLNNTCYILTCCCSTKEKETFPLVPSSGSEADNEAKVVPIVVFWKIEI